MLKNRTQSDLIQLANLKLAEKRSQNTNKYYIKTNFVSFPVYTPLREGRVIFYKKKFRPGTLVYGKRGGLCRRKDSTFVPSIRTCPRKKQRDRIKNIQQLIKTKNHT
jgi:hypothetical protein